MGVVGRVGCLSLLEPSCALESRVVREIVVVSVDSGSLLVRETAPATWRGMDGRGA